MEVTPYGTRTDTIIAIDFTKKIILIGNSSYAGEMKKSVFTTLNFYLPAQGVMPMHCSANVGGGRRLRAVRRRRAHILYPMKTWKDKAAFDETARKLVRIFQENFVKFEKHVDADVRSAAPEVRIAAE